MLATEALSASAAIIEQIGNQRRAVDFDTYDISVQQLIAMVENSQIDVAPVSAPVSMGYHSTVTAC